MGLEAYDAAVGKMTTREKLKATKDQRDLRAQRVAELRERRRAAIVDECWMPDEEVQRECSVLERDLDDFDVAIAHLEQQVADEEEAERRAAEEAAAEAEARRLEERRQARQQVAKKLDKAIAQVERAFSAWLAEQHDAAILDRRRQRFNLLAALHALAPGLATELELKRVLQKHRRPLGEVAR